MSKKIFSVADARAAARVRMPRIFFDYVDGSAGNEYSSTQNSSMLDEIRLLPRVLVNVEGRQLSKSLLGREWALPFGIAPVGMCNLVWPNADAMLAAAAVKHSIPLAVSTMASSTLQVTRQRAGDNAWFQLYVGQSEKLGFELVRQAEEAGYDTLILTVDVPLIAPRPREQRNGFGAPLKIGPRLFCDFALHPRWSIESLIRGIPRLANKLQSSEGDIFERNEGRGKIDWGFLERLRQRWPGKLIVKGVLSAQDAVRIRDSDVDAVYVSNHGGRQFDSAPTAIQMLPGIRQAVGDDYPIIFDSGIRNGEAVVKALALGADFVMIGRPFLYAMGAAGEQGLDTVIRLLADQVDNAMAQVGQLNLESIDTSVTVLDG